MMFKCTIIIIGISGGFLTDGNNELCRTQLTKINDLDEVSALFYAAIKRNELKQYTAVV